MEGFILPEKLLFFYPIKQFIFKYQKVTLLSCIVEELDYKTLKADKLIVPQAQSSKLLHIW